MSEKRQIWKMKRRQVKLLSFPCIFPQIVVYFYFQMMNRKQRRRVMYTLDELVKITEKLRSESGCPWDRKQTYESLKPCLEEECGEVLTAIENGDMDNLCEELGDVLFLLVMESQIAKENGAFTMDDVVAGVCEKMVRRHPHVFGDAKAGTVEEGLKLWNEIKKQEKQEKNQKDAKNFKLPE